MRGPRTVDAYIALGANLGQPLETLRWAVPEIAALGEWHAISGVYRTAPVGGPPGQPDYLNAALHLKTTLPPQALLAALHALEARAGRQRRERWEARILDLDLIVYGDWVVNQPDLMLPHPRAWERPFVLVPLHDLNPDLAHSQTGETVAEALSRVGHLGVTAEPAQL